MVWGITKTPVDFGAGVAPPSTLLTDLTGYWKLADVSDSGENELTLTNNNVATFVAGHIGNAVSLVRASTQFLSRASEALLQTGNIDFTIAAWAKPTTRDAFAMIVAKNGEFDLRIDSTTNKWEMTVTTGGLLASVAGATTGVWQLVIGWRDATAGTLNISLNNGTTVTVVQAANAATASAWQIGARDGANTFNGLIDEVGFWKRVLTADERTALYNAGAGVTYPFS